ncbi:MAG: NADH-quinone oxidoreductase subunit C [Acidimicrobiia bacterium]
MADEPTPDEPTAPEAPPQPEPEPEPEPEPDPVVAELLERLRAELGDAILGDADSFGTLVVRVRPDAWRRAGEVAKQSLECDYLSFVAGIDWQPATVEAEDAGDTSSPAQPSEMTFGNTGSAGRFQVLAHVESTTRHWGITLKADVDEQSPHLASWVPVYPGADWHERECWEMFGIVFDGHPSLRHLYLPGEFEGHPLRKDFPLIAREVKPWPGLVDVEPMPDEDAPAEGAAPAEVGEGT